MNAGNNSDQFGQALECPMSNRLLHAACAPLQKGLLSDLPHLHNVIRFRIS